MQNLVDFYNDKSTDWDTLRDRSLVEKEWLDKLLSWCPSQPSILDAGCGAGRPVAEYLIKRGARLTGVDASLSMIQLCESRFPSAEWLCQNILSLRLNTLFDAIVAWDWLFHLQEEDQKKALFNLCQHLKCGGIIMFTSGAECFEATAPLLGEHVYFASLSPEDYRALAITLGLKVVDVEMRDPNCTQHTVWLAQKISPQ